MKIAENEEMLNYSENEYYSFFSLKHYIFCFAS